MIYASLMATIICLGESTLAASSSIGAPVEALCLAVLHARGLLALAAALFAQVAPLRELGDEVVLVVLLGLVDVQGPSFVILMPNSFSV